MENNSATRVAPNLTTATSIPIHPDIQTMTNLTLGTPSTATATSTPPTMLSQPGFAEPASHTGIPPSSANFAANPFSQTEQDPRYMTPPRINQAIDLIPPGTELGGILQILTRQDRENRARIARLEAALGSRTSHEYGATPRNLLEQLNAVARPQPEIRPEVEASLHPAASLPQASHQLPATHVVSETRPEPTFALATASYVPPSISFPAYQGPEPHVDNRNADIEDLRRQLRAINSRVHRTESAAPEIDRVIQNAQNTPFTQSIITCPLRDTSKVKLPRFEGNADPGEHLAAFHIAVMKARFQHHEKDAGYCRLFAENLGGEALRWFSRLPRGSIGAFAQLESAFATHYASYVKREVTATELWKTVQKTGESLRSYIDRYRDISSRSSMPDFVTIPALQNGLLRGARFKYELEINEPRTLEDALFRAQTFIRIEEEEAALGGTQTQNAHAQHQQQNDVRPSQRTIDLQMKARRSMACLATHEGSSRTGPTSKRQREDNYDANSYCDFHRRPGHSTQGCRHLNNLLVEEYKNGKINVPPPSRADPQQGPRINSIGHAQPVPQIKQAEDIPETYEHAPPPPRRRINMIMGGLMDCNDSVRSIRASERRAYAASRQTIASLPTTKTESISISFGNADLCGIDLPHNDPLVIAMQVADCEVARMLVDTGSSINLMFKKTLDEMDSEDFPIKPKYRSLTGFNGESSMTIGTVTLPVGDHHSTRLVKFQVIDKPTIYNAILGTPWLHQLKAVASTYHQCVKYPTKSGVAIIRGSQAEARLCFENELKLRNRTLRCQAIRITSRQRQSKSRDHIAALNFITQKINKLSLARAPEHWAATPKSSTNDEASVAFFGYTRPG